MVYCEIIPEGSKIHAKDTNTLFGRKVEIFEYLKLPLAFQGVKRAKFFLCATTQSIRRNAVSCWTRVIFPAGKEMPFCAFTG
jgi:hypothetical protein